MNDFLDTLYLYECIYIYIYIGIHPSSGLCNPECQRVRRGSLTLNFAASRTSRPDRFVRLRSSLCTYRRQYLQASWPRKKKSTLHRRAVNTPAMNYSCGYSNDIHWTKINVEFIVCTIVYNLVINENQSRKLKIWKIRES